MPPHTTKIKNNKDLETRKQLGQKIELYGSPTGKKVESVARGEGLQQEKAVAGRLGRAGHRRLWADPRHASGG